MEKMRLIILLTSLIVLFWQVQSQTIDSGLVSHWSFDNDMDNMIIDATANNLHGTSYDITYTAGPIAKAVSFNGLRSRIYFPDKNSNPPQIMSTLSIGSIALWFKFQNQDADILPILYFGESATGTPHNSLIIEIGHGQTILNRKLYFTIVNQRFCYDSKVNLNENIWYHFVAVVTPTFNTGYLNGVEMTNRNYNLGSNSTYSDFFADVPTQKSLSLGYGRYGQQDPFYAFKGSIDDVRIYDRPLSATEVVTLYELASATNISIPKLELNGISLNQNYPNPFNTETVISWYSSKNGKTKLELFDMMGKQVKTLVDTYKNPGNHQLNFNSENLLPGVYYYQLQIDNERSSKRMILLK